MTCATVVYPHQLFAQSPALDAAKSGGWPVYLVEEFLLLTRNPSHRQKLLFHKFTLNAYERYLHEAGHSVIRLKICDYPTTGAVFDRLRADGVTRLHIVDTTDYDLEKAIRCSGLKRTNYDSPLFLLAKEDACSRFEASGRHLARFYKQLRLDRGILLEQGDKPLGGQWSFDEENRKKLPRKVTLPEDIQLDSGHVEKEAEDWLKELEALGAEVYGETANWLPVDHESARAFLDQFLTQRFAQFGVYEDAISTRGTRLFHSTLSPLMNVGLLTAEEVLEAALTFAREHKVPINSLEGFVRQVLGWREFVRASYEVDGVVMRNHNFWQHERKLPDTFWQAETGIEPVDHVIRRALDYGYTHHIERLMVLGNFMLLCRIHPHEVYRWFMAMYVDAYDWVMVPNVYGMSQFADGGSFATKPYISGANYIKKMSDFKSGDWEQIWTALYWYFIHSHKSVFADNHRMSMMPRLLANMSAETREAHFRCARDYLG